MSAQTQIVCTTRLAGDREAEADDEFASFLVSRLRGAVLRAPSPTLLFHAIASPAGHVLPSDLAHVLSRFEASIIHSNSSQCYRYAAIVAMVILGFVSMVS